MIRQLYCCPYKNSIRNSSEISTSDLFNLKSRRMNTCKNDGLATVVLPSCGKSGHPIRMDVPSEQRERGVALCAPDALAEGRSCSKRKPFSVHLCRGVSQIGRRNLRRPSRTPGCHVRLQDYKAAFASPGCSRAVLMLLFSACPEAVLLDKGACPKLQSSALNGLRPGPKDTRCSS